MTQARFDLDPYTIRVLDVVKGKYGLKNRNEALKKFVEEQGASYAQPTVREEVLQELDSTYEQHMKENGFSAMSESELNDLLGL